MLLSLRLQVNVSVIAHILIPTQVQELHAASVMYPEPHVQTQLKMDALLVKMLAQVYRELLAHEHVILEPMIVMLVKQ